MKLAVHIGRDIIMAATPILLRMVASSVSLAASAGRHIRRIMKSGHLEVVDKVSTVCQI